MPAARPAPYPARLLPVLSRTDSQGWQLRLLSIRVDADEHQRLVHEQQHDRDTEYAEVVERAPQLLAELALETNRGRANLHRRRSRRTRTRDAP